MFPNLDELECVWEKGGTMSIEQVVAEKMRTLPPEKQKEVLDFVDFLYQKRIVKGTRRSVKGLWADLGVKITEDDIAEVRGELWTNFPRGDI
jgi:hypothetical protein